MAPFTFSFFFVFALSLAQIDKLPSALAAATDGDLLDLDKDSDGDDAIGGEVVFDCSTEWEDGAGRWALSWSAQKKNWCCEHAGVACDAPRSEPYLCDQGVPNWKQGWSRPKQDWCCRHHNVGCRDEVKREQSKDRETMLAAVGLPADYCGVSSSLDDETGEFRPPPHGLQPVCDTQLTTNCSVSYSTMRCPSECGYIAPNPHFVCVFQCVAADECSKANVNRPFADPVARLCTGCQVQGCLQCHSGRRCLKCHDSFDLSPDGSSCTFRLASSSPLKIVGHALKAFVTIVVLAGVLYTCIRGRHPNAEENMLAISRARKARHLCKVLDWNATSHRHVAKHYPLGVPVHQEVYLGVGLPLFYNSICFVLFASLVTAFATWSVYSQSQIGHVLGAEHRSEWDLAAENSLLAPFGRDPAMVASPLASCGERSAADVTAGLQAFAERNFHAIGLLYVVLFTASLIHGCSQLRAARRYSRDHSMMSDFALHLSGMHKDLVDEEDLLKKIQQAIDSVFRNDESPQVHGVSICYDFSEVKEEVKAMKDRLVQRMDMDVKKKAGSLDQTEKQLEYGLREQVGKDRITAQGWFAPSSSDRLKSTGEVFVIFKRREDKSRAWAERMSLAHELQGLAAETSSTPATSSLRVNLASSEPPAVLWEHAGTSGKTRAKNLMHLALKTFVQFIALQALCIVPYALGVVLPFYKIGTDSAGTAVRLLGLLVGTGNQLLGLRLLTSADALGIHHKDTLDVVVFLANLGIAFLNTVVSLAVQAAVVGQVTEGTGPRGIFHIGTVQSIGSEAELASSFFNTLMPGFFFLSYLLIFLAAGMLPFLCNTLLMKSLYVWRCYPDCMLRRLQAWLPGASRLNLENYPAHAAEKALQVMKVGLSWEYGSLIVTPTICFSMLFFLSPFVWRTFVGLSASTTFFYCFCRCMHFRVCQPGHFTTKRLDVFAQCFWGLPLSVVAAAAMYWGIRSRSLPLRLLEEEQDTAASVGLEYGLVLLSFFLSLAIYLATYLGCARPWRALEEQAPAASRDIDAVAAACFYTWYNCNPVFTLKCEYYFQSKTRISDSVVQKPGTLRITLEGLRDADWLPFCGGSDPYCVVELMSKPQSRISTDSGPRSEKSKPKSMATSVRSFFSSSTSSKAGRGLGSSPVWNFSGELRNYAAGDALKVTVFDKDPLKKDDVLGVAVLSPEQVSNGFSGDLPLKESNGQLGRGSVSLSFEAPEVSQTQTKICIKQAGGLRDADWVGGKSDCFCVCEVVGKPEMQIVTEVCSGTDDPVWNLSTGLELDSGDSLVFTVMDKDLIKQSDCLGTVTIPSQKMTRHSRGPLALSSAKSTSAFLEVEIEPPETGLRHHSSNAGAHPMACGPDPDQIRFYQVGKEYLFLDEEKQRMLKRGVQDSLEPETILEGLFYLLGSKPQHLLAAISSSICCCLSKTSPSTLGLPGVPKDSSRRFLAVRTGESSP